MTTVLLVHTVPLWRASLASLLGAGQGIEVTTADREAIRPALAGSEPAPDVFLTDLDCPDSLDLLEEVRSLAEPHGRGCPLAVLTRSDRPRGCAGPTRRAPAAISTSTGWWTISPRSCTNWPTAGGISTSHLPSACYKWPTCPYPPGIERALPGRERGNRHGYRGAAASHPGDGTQLPRRRHSEVRRAQSGGRHQTGEGGGVDLTPPPWTTSFDDPFDRPLSRSDPFGRPWSRSGSSGSQRPARSR